MKRILALLVVGLLMSGGCHDFMPQAIGQEINLKQGFLYLWKDGEISNLTTVEVAKTKPVENFGKWNILWDGWTLDAGFAYKTSSLQNVALVLGRDFGTLGKYLPIDFPFKDKIQITLYPIGLYVRDIFDHPTLTGCSGGGFIKLSIKF